jgi:hypothetical protein
MAAIVLTSLVALTGLTLVFYIVAATRKGIAASLVGEVVEILELIEAHKVRDALTDPGRAATALPWSYSPVIYAQHASRIGLLGAHRARLIASFYSSAEALSDEIKALAADLSETGRTARGKIAIAELEATFELGDETLQSLRPLISRGRSALHH